MITKNVMEKAKMLWSEFLEPISKISENDNTHVALVDHQFIMYNFDKITKNLYNNKACPTSADALFINDKEIEFIEFKSGFKQKITKNKLRDTKAKCDEYFKMTGHLHVCKTFWELFFKNQNRERKILIESIRLKSIESYMSLEKKVLNTCDDLNNQKKIKVKFTIVIDEDGIDNYEKVLGEISNKPAPKENCFTLIEESLKRIKNQNDSSGQDYLYDEISVLSTKDFIARLNSINAS